MNTDARRFDVIVLGAGAAGLMCAATAGQRGRRVALLEHNGQVGRKILISGGGRCNFTNLHCGPENFLSSNEHFAKSALALYRPLHFVELVNRYGIAWHEKKLGQLFCDHSARAIVEMLVEECRRGTVEIILNAGGIKIEGKGGAFHVKCLQGEFEAEALVVATGGLSIPKLGATGFGYELARRFGMKVIEPKPALVPFVLEGNESAWTSLAGVAADVSIGTAGACGEASFREKLLVTHRGLSGPAVLQASSYWHKGEDVKVDFAPGIEVLGPLRQPGAQRGEAALKQALHEVLPQRLAGFLAEACMPRGWSNAALAEYEKRFHSWVFHPVSTEGFDKAEVTSGGVDTAGLKARTLEALEVPGLFFVGEVVDVTGWLGGYNFQWAWASGTAAGRAV
jgi:hypothetical protein